MAIVKKTYSITDRNDAWVKAQVESGRYATDSEYLRDLIRKDEERQSDVEAIRAALIEGEESGLSDMTPDQIMDKVIARKRKNGEL